MKHDIQIVKKAVKGDSEAFESLLFNEEKMLYYKALSLLRNKEDALDAIQETAYHAYQSIRQLRQCEYFSTWLFRILIRECYKVLKKRDRLIPYEEQELLRKLEFTEEVTIESCYLNEALSKLNSSYQTVIILFYYHDMSIKDISKIIDKPVSTVKTHLHRAKKTLKFELERSYLIHENIT
ncbi:sigma-70 family RNA polymerase sigma factor [Alkalicoccobacillus gibsonii]|uniref:sigma-70 family RNA polymerase sigma factor n=1 Tax=Alkalicoccobacillus gibsonii TaxID=79881 RepID=UPI0035174270